MLILFSGVSVGKLRQRERGMVSKTFDCVKNFFQKNEAGFASLVSSLAVCADDDGHLVDCP
jgi:hypothetical protein